MSDKQETLTDIAAEMRSYADTPPPHRAWRVRATYEFEVGIPGLELAEEIEEYLRDHAAAIVEHSVATLAGWEEVEEKEEI